MVAAQRKKFVGQADAALVDGLQEIAQRDEREFDEVLADAMRNYIMLHKYEGVRPEVMAHFRASVERNRKLLEMLAQ